MDTRFWGPSGWKMLHLLTFTYDPATQKSAMRKFLEALPFVLPCKFCRASLTDYYREHPYTPALASRALLTKWMYTIHNCVNGKLREQGLNPQPDPTFKQVSEYYTSWLTNSVPMERIQTFWDFLFSVGYCHPVDTARKTTPMPNCPKYAMRCHSRKVKNKWNVLCPKERMPMYRQFWTVLPDVLEPAIQITWKHALQLTRPTQKNRMATMAWLWRMRCAIDADFKDPYTTVCKSIATYSSDCGGKSAGAKTCRKRK